MELSILLAKVIGIFLTVISLAFIINKKTIKILFEWISNEATLLITGFFSLFIGLFMVLSHNIWTSDFRVIITIFGWGAVLKGFCRIFFPKKSLKIIKKFKKGNKLSFFIFFIFIIGIYLIYSGFYS